jgi:hypothetical protein
MQTTNIIRTISLIGAFILVTLSPTARAEDGDLGNGNTAEGTGALGSPTLTGADNTAMGLSALLSNTTGNFNTAVGYTTLHSNTTGIENTAIGFEALDNNTGSSNTAVGSGALGNNTTGQSNTASGISALYYNTTGSNNTGDGENALINNTTGGNNIALGESAGSTLTTGSYNIDIGNVGVAAETRIIRIGTRGFQRATFIAGIFGVPVGGPNVTVNAAGQLGVAPSSRRYKEAIKPMDKTSEAILALRPVTFRYKKELDPEKTAQFGLVAEEVEKVSSDLVIHDEKGKPYTVRYEAVDAMLLNEFLKEHRKVESLEASVAKLQSVVQKVSNQMELMKSAPQVVSNH